MTICGGGKTVGVVLVVVLGILVVLLSVIPGAPLSGAFVRAGRAVQSLPRPLAMVTFALLYGLSNPLFVPGVPFDMAAGFLFGFGPGTAVSIAGLTLGSVLAFALGRVVGSGICGLSSASEESGSSRSLGDRGRIWALSRAVTEEGLLLTLLLRLSPLVPLNLCSQLLALTSIPFSTYVLASLLGLIIPTSAVVLLGSLSSHLEDMLVQGRDGETRFGGHKTALTVAFAAITCMLMICIAIGGTSSRTILRADFLILTRRIESRTVTKRALDRVMERQELNALLVDSPRPPQQGQQEGESVAK